MENNEIKVKLEPTKYKGLLQVVDRKLKHLTFGEAVCNDSFKIMHMRQDFLEAKIIYALSTPSCTYFMGSKTEIDEKTDKDITVTVKATLAACGVMIHMLFSDLDKVGMEPYLVFPYLAATGHQLGVANEENHFINECLGQAYEIIVALAKKDYKEQERLEKELVIHLLASVATKHNMMLCNKEFEKERKNK